MLFLWLARSKSKSIEMRRGRDSIMRFHTAAALPLLPLRLMGFPFPPCVFEIVPASAARDLTTRPARVSIPVLSGDGSPAPSVQRSQCRAIMLLRNRIRPPMMIIPLLLLRFPFILMPAEGFSALGTPDW